MARIITKELALKIRDKLEAQNITPKHAAHDKYGVYHNGQLVGTFGIRRASEKDKGHDHVQKNLNIRTAFAKQLAICTKSREDYLREIGQIPALPESPTAPELPESSEPQE
ncbi:MAG TPA: hypothetical protein VN176_03660 [Verrucomicrobiae bacterium]|jgi:hypothetical protein|nr:hypothetical protein [Verrucomicrobiae bacterium]